MTFWPDSIGNVTILFIYGFNSLLPSSQSEDVSLHVIGKKSHDGGVVSDHQAFSNETLTVNAINVTPKDSDIDTRGSDVKCCILK